MTGIAKQTSIPNIQTPLPHTTTLRSLVVQRQTNSEISTPAQSKLPQPQPQTPLFSFSPRKGNLLPRLPNRPHHPPLNLNLKTPNPLLATHPQPPPIFTPRQPSRLRAIRRIRRSPVVAMDAHLLCLHFTHLIEAWELSAAVDRGAVWAEGRGVRDVGGSCRASAGACTGAGSRICVWEG